MSFHGVSWHPCNFYPNRFEEFVDPEDNLGASVFARVLRLGNELSWCLLASLQFLSESLRGVCGSITWTLQYSLEFWGSENELSWCLLASLQFFIRIASRSLWIHNLGASVFARVLRLGNELSWCLLASLQFLSESLRGVCGSTTWTLQYSLEFWGSEMIFHGVSWHPCNFYPNRFEEFVDPQLGRFSIRTSFEARKWAFRVSPGMTAAAPISCNKFKKYTNRPRLGTKSCQPSYWITRSKNLKWWIQSGQGRTFKKMISVK